MSQDSFASASRSKEPNYCCMTDSTLGSSNNEVILNQFVPAALEHLQDLPEQLTSNCKLMT